MLVPKIPGHSRARFRETANRYVKRKRADSNKRYRDRYESDPNFRAKSKERLRRWTIRKRGSLSMLSLGEAGGLIGFDPISMHRLCMRGIIPKKSEGGRAVLFTPRQVIALMEAAKHSIIRDKITSEVMFFDERKFKEYLGENWEDDYDDEEGRTSKGKKR